MNTPWIVSEERKGLGIVTLNSPNTLNALSFQMIKELRDLLQKWKEKDSLSCIFLQGAGEKAFCAGGDIRRLRDSILRQKEKDPQTPAADCVEFFTEEYSLDYEIHRYPKPILVWGDGIVMGGGMGLMTGASHRIVTERSKLAMPEITIGLFPDVAGTWFLNRMPKGWGPYLGLTGTRLVASDCIYLGLADFYIPSDQKTELLEHLNRCEWRTDASENRLLLTELLKKISRAHPTPESPAQAHEILIAQTAGIQSAQEFGARLLSLPQKDEWLSTGIKNFKLGSPSSACITVEQLLRGKDMTLEEVFRTELNLSIQCTLHPDLAEGVRALLVDKDQKPRWSPPTLDEISKDWIDGYFKPLWTEREHPLKHLSELNDSRSNRI